MIYMFKNGVEMFYTFSKDDEDFYDQLYIMVEKKKYILEVKERDYAEILYDVEENKELFPMFVSRIVFDSILEGLKNRGFKRYKTELY